MKYFFLLFLGTGILLVSCSGEKSSIEIELLNKCIKAHGGIDKWESLSSTDYTKSIVLYDKEGSIEKEIFQTHSYNTTPKLTGTIQWTDSINRKIVYKNDQAYKVNGGNNEEPSESALNTFNSAYYVLNMPWKLMDESAVISYLGLDTILNNKVVHTLRVKYPSETQNDVWEYYLDEKEYFLVANMVHHGSTYSFITNDEYNEYKGLKFNAKRTSYMVDSLGEVLYKRAGYEYLFLE